MPETELITRTVPLEACNARLDVTLATMFPEFSRARLVQWLQEGHILVDGNVCKPRFKLHGGEFVSFQRPVSIMADTLPEAQDIALDIVYEDDEVLVINKPAGLVVHPGAGNPRDTLLNALLHYAPALSELPRGGIVHRLDKDTTGLMVVAKTLEAQTSLVRQLEARVVERRYLALVHGHVTGGGMLETGYGRHPRQRLKMAVLQGGKVAITHYRLRAHFPGCSLLDVHLKTGRTHQIRVHMSHLHHPLIGDSLYGSRRIAKLDDASLRQALTEFPRQALHAATLAFTHPTREDILTCEAPLPQDFASLLELLGSTDEPDFC